MWITFSKRDAGYRDNGKAGTALYSHEFVMQIYREALDAGMSVGHVVISMREALERHDRFLSNVQRDEGMVT